MLRFLSYQKSACVNQPHHACKDASLEDACKDASLKDARKDAAKDASKDAWCETVPAAQTR